MLPACLHLSYQTKLEESGRRLDHDLGLQSFCFTGKPKGTASVVPRSFPYNEKQCVELIQLLCVCMYG